MRSWKFWVGLLVSLFFIVIAVRGLDFEHFWAALREANYWWLLPGVGVYFVPALIALQAAMPIKEMPTSTATFGLVRSVGRTVHTIYN